MNKFSIYHNNVVPALCTRRKFYEHELQNPLNKNLQGVKTLYFFAAHVSGASYVNQEVYSEYVWSPKVKLNEYFTKEYYESVIDVIFNK